MFAVQKAISFEMSDLHIDKGAGEGGPSEIGVFTGYASTFNNTDRDGDIVLPGAFPSDINARTVKMLRQHKHTDLIGVWKSIKPDAHGLLVNGAINLDVQMGRETYSLMKQGALDAMSVGMGVPRDSIEIKEVQLEGGRSRKLRRIKKAILSEISLVTIGANPNALITDVKSGDFEGLPSVAEFRVMMRDADMSRKERSDCAREYLDLLKKWNLLVRDAGDDSDDDLARDAEAKKAADEAEKASAEAVAKAAADGEAIRKAIADAFGSLAAKF